MGEEAQEPEQYTEYVVEWGIDLNAVTPQEAALEAWDFQQELGTTHPSVFTVTEWATGVEYTIAVLAGEAVVTGGGTPETESQYGRTRRKGFAVLADLWDDLPWLGRTTAVALGIWLIVLPLALWLAS